jgi:hypothetical protein
MFQAILDRIQASLDAIVSRYVSRVVVAVPFVIAFAFGVAAASGWLSQHYGTVTAHTTIAAAFAVLGLAGAGALASRRPADATGAGVTTGTATSDGTTQSGTNSGQSGLGIAESLGFADVDTSKDETPRRSATSPFDAETLIAAVAAIAPTVVPAAIPTLTRATLKNLPVIVGIVVIAYLIYYDLQKRNAGPSAMRADEASPAPPAA